MAITETAYYRPAFQEEQYTAKSKSPDTIVSNAFDVDAKNRLKVTNVQLYDDIVSYLGEFRFQLPKYQYELIYEKDRDGKFAVRDPHDRIAMSFKARESIQQKRRQGLSSSIEEAEEKGLIALDDRLEKAKDGDCIVWASPPGNPVDGFGNYGFIFKGNVHVNGETTRLSMTAIRVDVADPDRMNGTMYAKFNDVMSTLMGKDIAHATPEAYRAYPEIKEGGVPDATIDATLHKLFPRALDGNEQRIFDQVVMKITPLIYEVIHVLRTGTVQERVTAFQTLENYALKLKKQFENSDIADVRTEQQSVTQKVIFERPLNPPHLDELIPMFGFAAPPVAGSCPIMTSGMGSAGGMGVSSMITSNLFNRQSSLSMFVPFFGISSRGRENMKTWTYELGDCQACLKKNVYVGPCKICKTCEAIIDMKENAKK